jgi:hypothetical protein
MLQTLNTLAGKISPHTPSTTDNNANKVITNNNNTNTSPYSKPHNDK